VGTRSTLTVGADTATRIIKAAIEDGRLSNRAIADILEVVVDNTRVPEQWNFTVIDGPGYDDDMWRP